ncbi:MAG: hypothetical protein QG577_2021, partial [Thermodesulfobacteriota bacterium]|nr:hypothetical protein [Thermodesulfobacteriota bacterium]
LLMGSFLIWPVNGDELTSLEAHITRFRKGDSHNLCFTMVGAMKR